MWDVLILKNVNFRPIRLTKFLRTSSEIVLSCMPHKPIDDNATFYRLRFGAAKHQAITWATVAPAFVAL